MKKFLFTLASIVAFGFAANAATVPTFAFSENEVEMGAGETMELAINVSDAQSYMKACDWTFNMVDPEGNLIESKVKLQYLQKYGTRARYQFFGAGEVAAASSASTSTSDGSHATNSTMTTTGIYKCVVFNSSNLVLWPEDEGEYLLFTLEVEQGWEDEYAEFKLVTGKCVMADASEGDAGSELDVAPFSMKIKNKDYQPAQPAQPAPVPTFVEENGQLAAVCEGHTVVLMLEGNVVANPYTLPAPVYGEAQTLNFTAYTVANADESGNSATVPYQVIIPAKPYENFTGDIVISDPDENGNVTITYTGNEDYTMVVKVDGQQVYPNNGVIVVPEGQHTIDVTISAENYNDKSASKDVTYTAPEVQDPAMAPSVFTDITGYETATVTITNNQEGGTVHYVIYNMADNSVYAQGEFTDPSKAIEVEGDGTYRVETYCTADGYSQSANTNSEFTILPGQTPTGISELINGKNVASVRYFNMAGQEMQEANGMTIIVTTYTDGTSSAVKVMK